jgi:hypothetical protein
MITLYLELEGESPEVTRRTIQAWLDEAPKFGLTPRATGWMNGPMDEHLDVWRQFDEPIRVDGNVVIDVYHYNHDAKTGVVKFADGTLAHCNMRTLDSHTFWMLVYYAQIREQIHLMNRYTEGHQCGYEDARDNSLNVHARIDTRKLIGKEEQAFAEGYTMGAEAYKHEHTP